MSSAVLFLDDSALARAWATRLFAELGLAVIAIGSAREADELDVARLAAALLDIELGDGLGTEVARRLRDAAPALPIAFLSAADDRDCAALREEARRFGPVFSKLSEADAAVRWIAEHAAAIP